MRTSIIQYSPLALAAALLIWRWWSLRHATTRHFCPGPKRSRLRQILLPTHLFTTSRCGYDLRGLIQTAAPCTCPECGTTTATPKQRRPSPRRFGLIRFAVAALLLVTLLGRPTVQFLRSGRWTDCLSTDLLLGVQTTLGSHTPHILHTAMVNRAYTPARLTPPQIRASCELFIDDLRADGEPWNASGAFWALRDPLAQWSIAPLHQALRSKDFQQRQMAADILRQMPTAPITSDLLRVTIESLSHESPFAHDFRSTVGYHTGSVILFLTLHAREAAPFLADGLNSDDWCQSFLCAVAAGIGGNVGHFEDDVPEGPCLDLMPAAVPILAAHLRDNDIEEDAKAATVGLVGFGPPVIPLLEPYLTSDDPQQVALIKSIIARLTIGPHQVASHDPSYPPTPDRITEIVHDPSDLNLWNVNWGSIRVTK